MVQLLTSPVPHMFPDADEWNLSVSQSAPIFAGPTVSPVYRLAPNRFFCPPPSSQHRLTCHPEYRMEEHVFLSPCEMKTGGNVLRLDVRQKQKHARRVKLLRFQLFSVFSPCRSFVASKTRSGSSTFLSQNCFLVCLTFRSLEWLNQLVHSFWGNLLSRKNTSFFSSIQ